MIKSAEYLDRRKRLIEKMRPGSIAIIPSGRLTMRNSDSEYPFRQNSDFLYLTGFNEPEAALVLIADPERPSSILFCRSRDPELEIWQGEFLGPERALARLAFTQAFDIAQLKEKIVGYLKNYTTIYADLGFSATFDHQFISWLRQAREQKRKARQNVGRKIYSLASLLHEMRLIKSPAEIVIMQRAAEISAVAHKRAMSLCHAGLYEYALQAALEQEFRSYGASPAYNCIVASGENACTLHYVVNNRQITAKDLILIDAGCELDGYASDISRTFPASGRFSAPQKALYEVVLAANKAAIEEIQAGTPFSNIHERALHCLTEGLVALGILRGKCADLIEEKAYAPYYMHGTGHWLGLDVHDVGDYEDIERIGKSRTLAPGMVMTVEPGLYIRRGSPCPEEFWGLGVRIEDDVALEQSGARVLTEVVPKTIVEIEAFMAR